MGLRKWTPISLFPTLNFHFVWRVNRGRKVFFWLNTPNYLSSGHDAGGDVLVLELVSLLLADDLACMNKDKPKSWSAPSLEPNTDRRTERLTNNSLNSNLQIVVHDLLPHDESDAIFPRHAGVFDVLHQPGKNAIKQECAVKRHQFSPPSSSWRCIL